MNIVSAYKVRKIIGAIIGSPVTNVNRFNENVNVGDAGLLGCEIVCVLVTDHNNIAVNNTFK